MHSKARLKLDGRLKLDEPVEYDVTDEGELSFSLTDSTKRLLRRFRTSLDAAGYDGDADTAHVVVWPPLPLSVRIRLLRVPETTKAWSWPKRIESPKGWSWPKRAAREDAAIAA